MNIRPRKIDFKSFLLEKCGFSFNYWLSIAEPYKSEIYTAYEQYLLDGQFDSSILNFIETTRVNNLKSERFRIWLKKRNKISHDSFKALPLPMKLTIYNQYLKECDNNVV